MASPFVHLHVHSEFSLLDGACQIAQLPGAAAAIGQTALALTDHGNLFGSIDFYSACKDAGIKPIIGYEAYVAPGDRTVKEPIEGVKDQGYHLVLLARNETGFRNLLRLSTAAYLEGFYYKPRIDKKLLAEHCDGLIVMTACLAGEVPRLLLAGRPDEARRVAEFYRDLVGPEHFFIEIQNHGIEDELKVMPLLAELAEAVGVGLVATNDVHYLRADDTKAHDALLCISTGKTLSDPARMQYPAGEFYIRSADEMAARFAAYPEALEATVRIADLCNLELNFKERHAPIYRPPDGMTDAAYLRKLCDEGLRWRYGEVTPELRERMDHELEVIESKNFSSYFLIVWDFVNYARQRKIPCGARGSGVGALVSYVLGFCDVDPLKYGLLFERFMDPSRNEMPDIDIDICQDGRAEVIQYVRDKYGADHVAQIITFGTMAARAVVRDVGRVLDIPLAEVDAIAKKIPAELKMTLDRALEVEPELRKMVADDPRVAELMDIARRLEGTSRHASVHAAGVVVADAPLVQYVPLCKVGDDVTTQWTMNVVEKVGLLKMDFLGLKTLSILQRAVELVAAGGGPPIDLENLPTDDPRVLALFARGETRCVFQFESSGMRDLLQKMKPDRFEDLIAANALYRPGPMEMIDDYIARKHGHASYAFPHPVMHEILDDTYGIMAYQEQVMQICNRLGDIPLPRAYKLIKAISKKKQDVIAAEEEVFKAGCRAKSLPDHLINDIWELITKFGGYGFNKSHSTRYAKIAYQTAYMKVMHPVEFMAAQLTYDSAFTDKVVEDIAECRRMGIKVLPPDVNLSDSQFTVVNGTIRFGLAAVKGVGEKAVEAIIQARREGGPLRSLFDFCERVDLRQVNRAVIDSLIKCGAFDSLGAARSRLAAALDRAIAQGSRAQADQRSGQGSLFGGHAADTLDEDALPDLPEWPPNELLRMEKEVLGFFVSSSPLVEHERTLRTYANATTADLKQKPEDAQVILGGMITARRERLTKQGSKMVILVLQDLEGSTECVVFDKTAQQFAPLLQVDQVVLIAGSVSRRWEEPSVRVDAVYSIDEARQKLTSAIRLRLRERALEDEQLQQLRDLLAAHPGRVPVHVELTTPNNYRAVILAGSRFRIQPDPDLLADIERLLGEGHLVLVGGNGNGNSRPRPRRFNVNGAH
jgi:DNA polymerase-3 subunit alpha